MEIRKIHGAEGVRIEALGSQFNPMALTRVWVVSYDGGNVEGAETTILASGAKVGSTHFFLSR